MLPIQKRVILKQLSLKSTRRFLYGFPSGMNWLTRRTGAVRQSLGSAALPHPRVAGLPSRPAERDQPSPLGSDSGEGRAAGEGNVRDLGGSSFIQELRLSRASRCCPVPELRCGHCPCLAAHLPDPTDPRTSSGERYRCCCVRSCHSYVLEISKPKLQR